MANRQNSGGAPAQQNERQRAQDDDALPELNDDVRGRADDEDDEDFEEAEDLDEEDDSEEGSY